MLRLFALIALIATTLGLLWSGALRAEPGDIDAAARGVVRVVIVASDGEEVYPVSHGSGFAVTSNTIVTNAHVVRDALADDTLRIGIVPSDGADAVYGRVLNVSPRNDLALIRLTDDLRLPPLALAGGQRVDSGESYAVGYPMNVDRAQGLELSDVFESQPPVKSRGFLAGSRPSRSFDTLLHTAPIARGNSGGPLLDGCGRVLGVNSFGADSGGSDAEFFFAVSNRELRPFLRENGITPRVNDTACRDLATLDAEERERLAREQESARADLAARAETDRRLRDRAQFEAEMAVRSESEDRLFIGVILLLIGSAAVMWAFTSRSDAGAREMESDAENRPPLWPKPQLMALVGGSAIAFGAVVLFITRPGIDEVDRRVSAALGQPGTQASNRVATADGARAQLPLDAPAGATRYQCTLDAQRSRVTSADAADLDFEWSAQGCVNGRTQYGFNAGIWSRVLAPNDEQAVSVNSFDPARRTFRTERYLLSRGAMRAAREARGKYRAPSCEDENAAARLGDLQRSVTAGLPDQPNERLVYTCETAR